MRVSPVEYLKDMKRRRRREMERCSKKKKKKEVGRRVAKKGRLKHKGECIKKHARQSPFTGGQKLDREMR